jgi:uncharacterized membrane protein
MRRILVVVQCLELLALSVWVGGLIVIIAAVIPAVFNTASMEVGGRIMTRTFQGYDRLVMTSAAVFLIGWMVRISMSGRQAVSTLEAATVIAMMTVALLLILYVNPTTVRFQEAAFTATENSKSASYTAFFRYHWLARGLYMVNLALGICALYSKVRSWQK